MTVQEIIGEGLKIRGVTDEAERHRRVEYMLQRVGLQAEHSTRYPHEFSGGQRQRIGIARALVVEPSMIIADEPVSALDVSVQAQVINLLNSLKREFHLTMMFIAHNLSVVKYISDRIGVMYYGKLVELAGSDEIYHHPLHPYTKALLSAVPQPDPHSEKSRSRIFYEGPQSVPDGDLAMRKVIPGHSVYCTEADLAVYRRERVWHHPNRCYRRVQPYANRKNREFLPR